MEVLQSLLDIPFFGLTPEYRLSLFGQIHEIVFHSKGSYEWHTVYNMPIWLRRFTYHKIDEYFTKQKEDQEKASGKQKLAPPVGPAVQNKPATYTAKAPKN